MQIEIRGVYDGICVVFDPKTKTFKWREIAIKRTTETYRKEFEQNFLKEL